MEALLSDPWGIEGLKDMSPKHLSYPQTTPPEVEEKVIASSLEHPSWDCAKLSDWPKLHGISISSPTVQKLLIKNSLGSTYQRWLKVEEKHLNEGIELAPEQVSKLEKYTPCFRERHVEPSKPGELLA